MKRLSTLVLVALTLVACSDSPPERGYVINKRYKPQHTHWHDGGSVCVSFDSKGLCNVHMPLPDDPHEHCVGGCYELRLEDCQTNGGKKKCKKGWIRVDAETYRGFGLGSHFPNPK